MDIWAQEKQTKQIAKECEWVAVAIGVQLGVTQHVKTLRKAGANIFVIDIAHGYCDEVINLAKSIKQQHRNVKVVVGNTTNPNMLVEVKDFADAIKVGIAQGSVCETRNTAGCTEKQFSAIWNCQRANYWGLPIISDGGIREPADVVKAIGAGAKSIMAGGIFARCPESAGETVNTPDGIRKVYAGMASRYVQDKWRGGLKDGTCPEGKMTLLPLGESVDKLIERYSGALRSGISYGGGKDIETFQNTVEFIEFK